MRRSLVLVFVCSFQAACSLGYTGADKTTVSLPVNCDTPGNGNYCVYLGVQNGDPQMVRKGLEIGGDPNTVTGYSILKDGTKSNQTVVHEAIRLGDLPSLELLISHERFDPSITVSFETGSGDISTFTYLDLALSAGYKKAVPVHSAPVQTELVLDILSLLLRKCDPNVAYGLKLGTILHTVVTDSHNIDIRVLSLLVSKGANPKIADKDGSTPVDIIERHLDSRFNSEQTRNLALGILKK